MVRVVRAARADDAIVEIDGRSATPEERDAVAVFVRLTPPRRSDDSIFGSREPRRVGEKWRPTLLEYAKELDFDVEANKLFGTVELTRVRQGPLGEMREIRAEMTAINPALRRNPEGVRNGPGTFKQVVTCVTQPDGFMVESHNTTTLRAKLQTDVADQIGYYDKVWSFEMTQTLL